MAKKISIERPKHFLIAFEKIKQNFSIVSSEQIRHFPDLMGYIEKIIISFQNQKIALFLVETHNDVQFRLFDTPSPEEYYVKEEWAPKNRLRSSRPFLLNWKCLYKTPKEESWCDVQIPLHRINSKTKAVLLKLMEIIEDIEKALTAA